MTEEKPEADGAALDPFQSIVYIQLQRIYDLLLLSLPASDQEKIVALHESGQFLAPPPIIAPE